MDDAERIVCFVAISRAVFRDCTMVCQAGPKPHRAPGARPTTELSGIAVHREVASAGSSSVNEKQPPICHHRG
jgi:hypothetical protein